MEKCLRRDFPNRSSGLLIKTSGSLSELLFGELHRDASCTHTQLGELWNPFEQRAAEDEEDNERKDYPQRCRETLKQIANV
jgi:hypothetical protein